MFVQSTLECNSPQLIANLKKAWKPGKRIYGYAGNGRVLGTEELASVLGYSDLDDMHEAILVSFVYQGLLAGLIKEDGRGGYTVDYPIR